MSIAPYSSSVVSTSSSVQSERPDDRVHRRSVRDENEVVAAGAQVRAERRARLRERLRGAPGQELDRLPLEPALPTLGLLQHRSRARAVRAVVEERNVGIEQELVSVRQWPYSRRGRIRPSCGRTSPSVPMPSLPRIKRTRSRAVAEVSAPAQPRLAELSAGGLTWVHLTSPTPEEAGELAERFGWHALDLEDVLSKRQRPKVDEYPEYLFVVLHFPAYDKAIQRLNAAELDVFLGPDFLITLPNVELLPVTRLFRRCEEDEDLRQALFSKGSGYLLYHVLDDLFDYCFPILDKIGHKLDSIEDDMFEGAAEDVVRDLSNVKQEIISYRKIIKPERSTLRVLEGRAQRFLPEELEVYFDDIVDAAERIWDLLDNYKEVVEALEDTNESVISHRQNDVLRILTIFSVTMLPLSLLAGIFGMNVGFPGEGTHQAFWIIAGAMVATLMGMVAFFRYKRWL
jgi:magnesium transporter